MSGGGAIAYSGRMAPLASQINPEQAEWVSQWAMLLLAIAIGGLILLVVAVLLVLGHRRRAATQQRRRGAGRQVDAWSEAGRRFQTPEASELEDEAGGGDESVDGDEDERRDG